MKKIWILAGIVLFLVLVIMCWAFFGNLFDFAKNLGEKSSDIALEEKTKFVGTWETTYIEDDDRFVGYNGIYTFNSDSTGSVGGLESTWEIVEEKLVIHYYEGVATLTYVYSFSEDNLLILTDSNGTLEFTKK